MGRALAAKGAGNKLPISTLIAKNMRLLCIHQNYPGQFRDLAPALVARGHEIRAIAGHQKPLPENIVVGRYEQEKTEKTGIDPLTGEVDDWIRRGRKVAAIAEEWRNAGWAPDAVLAHPGWGEALFIREVYPSSALLIWPELWLRDEHMGLNRGDGRVEINQRCYLRVKNWLLDGALGNCTKAIVPTKYQADCFPPQWHDKIIVLHEGVKDELLNRQRLNSLCLGDKTVLGEGIKVVSYASRNLEPMRGFDRFLQSVVAMQQHKPDVHVLIAGSAGSSYSGEPEKGKSWKDIACEAVKDKLDQSKVHFLGYLDHESLIHLFLRSDLHVYLSNNFVLSWSVLEAMACGAPLLVDDNPMLREIETEGTRVTYSKNKDPQELAQAMIQILNTPRQINNQTPRQIDNSWRHSNTITELELLIKTSVEGMF